MKHVPASDAEVSRGNVAPKDGGRTLRDKTQRERELRWDRVVVRGLAVLVAVGLVGAYALTLAYSTTSGRAARATGDAWFDLSRPLGAGVRALMPSPAALSLALGVAAAAFYVAAAVYALRHARRRQSIGRMRVWLEVHLAVGLLSMLAAVLHAGVQLGAPLHAAFLVAWCLLVLTGVAGKVLSVRVPRLLTRIEDEALLVEDVAQRRSAMRQELEDHLLHASAEHALLLERTLPRAIRSPDWYGRRRMKHADVVREVYAAIDGDARVPAEQREWLQRVVTCAVEERFLGRMLLYHWLLRAWLPIHIGLTALCLPWLVVHAATALYFVSAGGGGR